MHDALDLFFLIFTLEDGFPAKQFKEDAAERPHVDGRAIPYAQYYFWRSIEPTLNVGVILLVLIRSTPEVDHFYSTFVLFP